MSARVEALLARLSWEQKLAQMQIVWRRDLGEATALARRGIGALFWPASARETNQLQRAAVESGGVPLLIALDVVHGQRTIFPTPLAQAASFDRAVAAADARVSAREARSGGVNWTYSPMVDVTRDPRWGRVVEGFGEDALLTSTLGAVKARAYRAEGVAACLKHFAAYGAAEAGRDYNTADVSRRRLRDVYLEPFRAGAHAGADTVMAAFTSVNGRPMHANAPLLTGVLKGEWGFEGLVVGDAEGVAQLVAHGVAETEKDAIRQAIEAGVDIVMGGAELVDARGAALLAPGEVDADRVDDAVRRILSLKERLGLLDDPFVRAEAEILAPTEESLAAARSAAERCIVLLRNEGALPLAQRGRVLVTGPYARSLDHLGAWVQHFAAPATSTLADALAAELPEVDWVEAAGSGFLSGSDEDIAEAVSRAADADLVIVAAGEPSRLSGEAASRADVALPAAQTRLIHVLADAGARVVVVLHTGRPLVVEDWIERVDAVLCTWHLGTQAAPAIAGALSGRVNPGGRLPMTFPRAVGQIPIHHDHERTGRPARTGGELLDPAAVDDETILGPNNTDDHYTSKFLDLPLGPRFAFGHGLSYTTFALDDLEVVRDDGGWLVSVRVRNTGVHDGDDVVLLFASDECASVAQPVRRLRGFERVAVPSGGAARVAFRLEASDLGFWTDDERFVIEPGGFELAVEDGMSAVRTRIVLEEAS